MAYVGGNPTNWYNGTEYSAFTWTQGRRLSSITTGGSTYTYDYDMDGIRTSKTVDGVVHNYVTLNGKVVQESYGDIIKVFIYDTAGNPYAMHFSNDGGQSFSPLYYVLNAQGDVVHVLNWRAEVCATYIYDAWGKILSATGPSATANPLRYRGYYYDYETGFYYLENRYYDPEIGRFISADGAISGVGGDIRGYNLYSYCMNNPVNVSDPDGNWPRWISAAVATVATVVAAVTSAPVAIAVAAVATLTYGLQVWHYDVRQSKNNNLPKTPQEANDAGWKNSNPKTPSNPNGGGPAAALHQYTSKDKTNIKYVSPNGHREVIFNSAGNIVTDSRDIGTYNFKPASGKWYSEESIKHFFADILPWFFLGNADDDWGPVINFFLD